PPYGIKYGSNFQPFTNKRDVKDNDKDLTQEPEMIKAFRDTWELGIHSYLSYMRDRLLLSRELLTGSGSIFVQISDENVHLIRNLMDETFGKENFISLITFKKTLPLGSSGMAGICDYLIWYSKDKNKIKYHELYVKKPIGEDTGYTWIEEENGKRRKMTKNERLTPSLISKEFKVFFNSSLSSSGYTPSCMFDFKFEGTTYKCRSKSWRTNIDGMKRLIEKKRIIAPGKLPCFIQYHNDFPVQPLHNLWNDTHGATELKYVVQTSNKVIQRCMLMTTDPGDLVLDSTCGSGTTAYVAEQWGRRWITCDTSRVAITLARQRLMTASYDYYKLKDFDGGLKEGFIYKTVPHITLKSIANDLPPEQETLYDQAEVDNKKARVSGAFTVESTPSPQVMSVDSLEEQVLTGQEVSRSGVTVKIEEWKDELFKSGIRGKGGNKLEFARLEIKSGLRYVHLEGETKNNGNKKVFVSFGQEHSPLDSIHVEQTIDEAYKVVPKPDVLVFASFHFDPEASKIIDEKNWDGVSLLKVQMNTDLLTEDLKKKRSSNDSFWLIGQPEIVIHELKEGDDKGKYEVEVLGFDYYNVLTGEIDSGDKKRIAMWLLDTDYDNGSLFPEQIFFPLSGSKDGWNKLAKNLKAEIDQEIVENFKGTKSLAFNLGKYKQIAVKVIDDRGIESVRVIKIGE
ncbi:MAG: site-specific DNA-methyltransferase, partial [Spirochaetota bacterium]|nr:site-specific DNA-methyltransferase [Spirochaetota bacterium]